MLGVPRRLARARVTIPSLVVIFTMLLAACGNDSQPPAPTAVSGSSGNTVNVNMANFKFNPQEITVPAGTTIVWTNTESPRHTVTADDNAFDSGFLSKGSTFSRKFDTPGTVTYYCKAHGSPGQGMIGRIIVTAGGATGQATAGGNEAPTTAPGENATPTPTVEVQAQATATPTAEEVAPTAAPPPPTTPPAPQTSGTVRFADAQKLSDQAIISINAVPSRPEGKAYFAWLTNSATGATANLGRVDPDANNNISLTYSGKNNANLLSAYDGFKLTAEDLETSPTAPSSNVVASGQLPPKSLVHMRHLLVAFDSTPGKIGLEVGLRSQVDLVKQHADYMLESLQSGNLAGVRLHAEHLVNIIEGAKGAHYGDLNGDGRVTNPGDGYGLLRNGDQLGYIQGVKDHAELAATAPDATADIKLHAGHVEITADNVEGWVTTIRDDALQVAKATRLSDTDKAVHDIESLATNALKGVDLQGNGQILPVKGSGGAITSYQHAQLMAIIPISIAGGGGVPPQPAATVPPAPPSTEATPTSTPGAPAVSSGSEVKVNIQNIAFGSGPITVKVGTKVTWTNLDTVQHTVTADNSAFDSGNLQAGQTFSYTFAQPGQFQYYCSIHGGPGNQGMSSTVNVQP